MNSFSELKRGQFAHYVDSGFEHGTRREYFVQRHPTISDSQAPDGRKISPILCYEITHLLKRTSHKDAPTEVIPMKKYGSQPILWYVDSRILGLFV